MEHTRSYIAIAECGCIRGAAVDNPAHRTDTSRLVAPWIRRGLRVEIVDTAAVREMAWVCEQHRRARAGA
ncbi:MAG: hypothetical protein ACM3US_07335 [Sphingomonadaceae bacterium]